MSGLRVTLSRSCKSCIKAKRKCNLESPSCGRCRTRNLRCVYRNELSGETLTPTMRSSLWLIDGSAESSNRHDQCDSACSFDVQHLCGRKLDLVHWSGVWRERAFAFADGATLRSTRPTFQPVELTLDNSTTRYILGTLRASRPRRMKWVHKDLMEWLPYPAKATKVMSLTEAASRHLDQQTALQLTKDLEVSTQELIAFASRARPSIATLLCCVQALLEAEIALAFGNASQHIDQPAVYARRARQVKTLSRWCWTLWELAPWVLPGDIGAEHSWLLAESVRRTLLVAHLFCDVFSVVFTGAFRFSGFVSTLPYDSRTWLWDNSGNVPAAYRLGESTRDLQSFRQLVIKFENGNLSSGAIDEFEQLLLVTCRGYGNVQDRLNLPDHPMVNQGDRHKVVGSIDPFGLDLSPFQ